MPTKKCTKCGRIKDETEFYPRKSIKGRKRIMSVCKVCHNARNRRKYRRNPQEYKARSRRWKIDFKNRDPIGYERCIRNEQLKRNFDITLEQYKAMAVAQNNRCAICGKLETSTYKNTDKIIHLAVDHNHETKKVRALLCGNCNQAIGLMRNNPERLEKAAAYLRYHKKVTR